jgi:hypothetical protein
MAYLIQKREEQVMSYLLRQNKWQDPKNSSSFSNSFRYKFPKKWFRSTIRITAKSYIKKPVHYRSDILKK